MQKTNSPLCLWDFASMLVAQIRNMTARDYQAASRCTRHEIVTGKTPGIAEYIAFEWYQIV
jgi:hypothetical protein